MFASRLSALKPRSTIRPTETPSKALVTKSRGPGRQVDSASAPSEALQCPVCDSRMSVETESALPPFGGVDFTLRSLKCDDCGMTSGLAFHPAIGYDREVTVAMRLRS